MRKYLHTINHFRAVAIIFIVFGHCFDLTDFNLNTNYKLFFNYLISESTGFFVIISGILFHHIFYVDFNYKIFILNKIKKIIYPYIFMSTPKIFYIVFFVGYTGLFTNTFFFSNLEDLIVSYFIPVLKYYFTGFHIMAYWYIPFIMLMFLISPIFIHFISLSIKKQIFISSIFIVLSMFVSRPFNDSLYSVFHSVLYFSPFYMIGIIFSQRFSFIKSFLNKNYFLLFFISILLLIIQVNYGNPHNFNSYPFVFKGFDFLILQKLTFSAFIIGFLSKFNYKINFLDKISKLSFGIYFSHGLIIYVLNKLKKELEIDFIKEYFYVYPFVGIFVFLLSYFFTIFMKKVFKNKSVYFVGS